MRDGARLCADLYEPSLSGPWPVMLIRLPYGKNAHPLMPARGTYWARKGYACVIQDVRGRWHSHGRWEPLVHEAEDGYDTLYLHSRGRAARRDEDGVLAADPPVDEPPDVFRYDPRDPVTWWLDRSLWELAAGLDDRRPVEARHDVAVYSGTRLEAGLTVVGPVSARLYVSSSCLDTDVTVALVDVFPDGCAQLVQEGVRRARFRESDREERLLHPDEVVPLDVDLTATAYRFGTGHRLRIEVSSSNFGRWDRNLNTGRDPGTDDRIAVASTSVWHDAGRPSSVTLSVVEARDEKR